MFIVRFLFFFINWTMVFSLFVVYVPILWCHINLVLLISIVLLLLQSCSYFELEKKRESYKKKYETICVAMIVMSDDSRHVIQKKSLELFVKIANNVMIRQRENWNGASEEFFPPLDTLIVPNCCGRYFWWLGELFTRAVGCWMGKQVGDLIVQESWGRNSSRLIL